MLAENTKNYGKWVRFTRNEQHNLVPTAQYNECSCNSWFNSSLQYVPQVVSDVPYSRSIYGCNSILVSLVPTPGTPRLVPVLSTLVSLLSTLSLVPVLSTSPATLTLIKVIRTVILATKCHSLEHSNLCRMIRRIKNFTLARFHSVTEIWGII
jgi:hypothetical protein